MSSSSSLAGSSLISWKRLFASEYVLKVIETYAAQVIIVGLQMTTTVIAARALGPSGRGLYAVALAMGMLGVRFSTFGLHASNTYYVAKNRDLLPSMTANTIVYSLVVGGLAALAIWVAFHIFPTIAPLRGPMLALAVVWIPFGLLYLLLQNLLIGIGQIRLYNLSELAGKLIVLALVAILVLAQSVSPENIFAVGLLILVGNVLVILFLLSRICAGPLYCSLSLVRESFRVGFRAYLISFFGFLVLRLDLLMVQKMLGSYQSGNYSIASTMADAVYILPTVFATMLFPKVCGMRDVRHRFQTTFKASVAVAALLVPLSVVASFLAVPIVRLMFGAAFSGAAPAFVWLMPGIIFLGVETVAVQFLNSFGFPASVVTIWVFSTALNIGLNLWVIPAYGINGAAAVSSLTYITTSLFIFGVIARTWKSAIAESAVQ